MPPSKGNAKKESGRAKKAENEAKKAAAADAEKVRTALPRLPCAQYARFTARTADMPFPHTVGAQGGR